MWFNIMYTIYFINIHQLVGHLATPVITCFQCRAFSSTCMFTLRRRVEKIVV